MFEVVVAGHVSLDVYPELFGPVRLDPGRLTVVGPARFSTGGVVTNTGLALHRLGARVALIGKVGDDLFGRAVRDALERISPGLAEHIVVSCSEATSYTIVINPPGLDRSFLHCSGANETFSADDIPGELLSSARLFHFGYPPLMPRMYAGGGAELGRMFATVQAAGLATCLDMCALDPDTPAGAVDWRGVLARALPHVDVFAPSLDELLFMVDRPAHERLRAGGPAAAIDGAGLSSLSERLIGFGAAAIAIKLGDQGLYLRTSADAERVGAFARRAGLAAEAWRGRELLSPCFAPRTIAGTTGSGDATIAGLLAALLRGATPAEAATAATAVGACSVEAIDPSSGIPDWRAVTARIAGGWTRRSVAIDIGPGTADDADGTGTLSFRP